MRISYLFIFLSFFNIRSSVVIENLIDRVINEVQPNRVTLHSDFKNGNITNHCIYQTIFEHLSSQVPTVTVNLNSPPPFMKWKRDILEYNPNFTAPLHFVILSEDLYQGRMFYKFRDAVWLIYDSLFYLSSTKIILVVNTSVNFPFNLFNIFFRIAEFENFIDFTIFHCNSKNYSISSYNRFSNTTRIENFDCNSNITLFPNKFDKMSGFKMRVGVNKDDWPHGFKNYTVNYSARDNLYLQTFSLKINEYLTNFLNISSEYVSFPNEDVVQMINKYGLHLYLGKSIYVGFSNLLNIYIIEDIKFILVVPVISDKSLKLTKDILYAFLVLFSLVLLFLSSAYFFKFKRDEWSLFNIFSLILGIGVNMDPRRSLRSIIMFFTLFVISFFFASDIISDLTKLNYEYNEIDVIKSFEEIFDKNLTVFFPYPGFSFMLSTLKNIGTTGIIKNVTDIAREPRYNDPISYNNIAIMLNDDAEKFLYTNNHKLGGIKHKISDLTVSQAYSTIIFPQNSPFRNKFADIHQRIMEFGLDVKWRSDYDHANKIDKRIKHDKEDDEDDPLVWALLAIMIFEIIISFVVLCFEYLWHYYLSKKLERYSLWVAILLNTKKIEHIILEHRN